MTHLCEVVITGWGVVCPIGIGKQAFASSLRAGQSGVGPITRFDTTHLPVTIGAEIKGFDAKQYVKPRKSLKVMGREIQTAVAAAAMAMDEVGLSKGDVDPDRLGVVLGTETMCGEYDDVLDVYRHCLVDGEFRFERWGEQAMNHIYPLWMLKYLPNMPACHIAIAYDGRGPNNSIALGDASSLLAIIEAASIIQRGDADVILAGGTSSRLNLTDLMWRGDSRLSHCADRPQAASRPFDAHRDGMVLGEGAAIFVLERREYARQRGAAAVARIAGQASVFVPPRDRYRVDAAAIRRAIAQSLESAGLQPADMGHVNAHGLSTREDDSCEAQVISATLGETPVTAPKSFFGNLGAGGGAVELAASLVALEDQRIPVTLNYETPDPACPVKVVAGEPLPSEKATALVLNYSGTGQAAALVLCAD